MSIPLQEAAKFELRKNATRWKRCDCIQHLQSESDGFLVGFKVHEVLVQPKFYIILDHYYNILCHFIQCYSIVYHLY